MSQAKVDKYKEEKANRKQIMKKEKRMHILRCTVATLVIVALLGWIGVSVYQKTTSDTNSQAQAVEADYSAFMEYLGGLPAEN